MRSSKGFVSEFESKVDKEMASVQVIFLFGFVLYEVLN